MPQRLIFSYDPTMDARNFIAVSRSRNHKKRPEINYEFEKLYGDKYLEKDLLVFIDEYLDKHHLNPTRYLDLLQRRWGIVEAKFFQKTERIFGVTLPNLPVKVFLTINPCCGYSIEQNWFALSFQRPETNLIVMHELWHFFTWHAFGKKLETSLGREKYNDVKEALTEILNLEFVDLLGEVRDHGYKKQEDLRRRVHDLWIKNGNMNKLLEELSAVCG